MKSTDGTATAGRIKVAIRTIAANRGVKLVQIERAIGVNHKGFYARLNGNVAWRIDELEAIADVLDCTVFNLLGEQLELAIRGSGCNSTLVHGSELLVA